MYQEIKPIKELQQYIDCIWLDSFTVSKSAIEENIFPDGSIELIFNISGKYYRQENDEFKTIDYSHIVGYKTHHNAIRITKGMKAIGVRIKTGYLSKFTFLHAYELADKTIALTDIFGDDFRLLESELVSTESVEIQLHKIQLYLLSKIKNHKKDTSFNKYLNIPGLATGLCSVEHIAQSCKTGYKKIERDFQKYIGVTPKTYLKVQRFNYAITRHNHNSSLTSLSYDCGYYDQNHFIKDVKSFTGQTPKTFFKTKSLLKNTIQDILVRKYTV